MTTSGTTTFMMDANGICTQALKRLGVATFGNAPRIDDIVTAQTELNLMVKSWRADGVLLWKSKWAVIPFTPSSVVIGTDGNAYECIRSHVASTDNKPITGSQYLGFWINKYSAWVTSTSYSVGSLVVGSDDNLYQCILQHVSAAADKPITGANFATYWSLYTTVTPSAWVDTTSYSSICNPQLNAAILGTDKRIIGIGNAFIRNDQSQDSYLNSHLQAYEYFRMGNKVNPGRPTMAYFKRNPDVDELFLYPYPDTNTWVLNVELYYYPDDFTDPTDAPDFLMEWEAALVDGLTARLYPLFPGRSRVALSELQAIFQETYQRAKSGDSEKGELQCVPDFWLNNGRY